MKTVEKLIGGAAVLIFVGIMLLWSGYQQDQWNQMTVGAVITVGVFSGIVYYLTWGDYKDEKLGPDEWTLVNFQTYVRDIYNQAKRSALKTSEYMEQMRGLIIQSGRLHGIEEDDVDFIINGLKDIADAEDEATSE